MTIPGTQEEARSNLKGGLRAVKEGLRDSDRPCTEVLSVPGFFAILELFPLGEGVYSQEKETSFLTGEASLLQQRGNKCHHCTARPTVGTTTRVYGEACTGGGYLPGYTREAYNQGVHLSLHTLVYSRVHTSPYTPGYTAGCTIPRCTYGRVHHTPVVHTAGCTSHIRAYTRVHLPHTGIYQGGAPTKRPLPASLRRGNPVAKRAFLPP